MAGLCPGRGLVLSGIALVEYAAVLAELKMARFELNGSWRNMATFG